MLTLYFAMRGSGLSGMLNPLEEQFNQVKNKLKKFVLREEQDFKIAYANKVQLQSSVVTKPLPILRSNLQENTEQPIPRIDKARLRHSF
jgi:hypothetical protein